MIRHHPAEAGLAEYAAGATREAEALLIATHLALCPDCRRRVGAYEALGGELLAGLPADAMAAGSLAATLARLDRPEAAAKSAPRPAALDPRAPRLPRPLRDYAGADLADLAWRPAAPGLSLLPLPVATGTAWLLRLAPGRSVPLHGHGGQEMVMVLAGGYHDGSEGYARGDVQASGPEIEHRPVADSDGTCVCLAVFEGRLRLSNPLGRLFGRLLGF
jgi:putative transcriptional regulator